MAQSSTVSEPNREVFHFVVSHLCACMYLNVSVHFFSLDKELGLGCRQQKNLCKLAMSVSTAGSDRSIRKRSTWGRSKSFIICQSVFQQVVSNNPPLISYRSKQKFIEFEGQNTVKINGTNSTGALGASKFNYDQVFDSNAPQSFIYEQAVKPIVMGVMEGFNGTVFAYG